MAKEHHLSGGVRQWQPPTLTAINTLRSTQRKKEQFRPTMATLKIHWMVTNLLAAIESRRKWTRCSRNKVNNKQTLQWWYLKFLRKKGKIKLYHGQTLHNPSVCPSACLSVTMVIITQLPLNKRFLNMVATMLKSILKKENVSSTTSASS